MTSIANTKTQWQVFIRRSAKHKWRAHGIYETRSTARDVAAVYRTGLSRGRKTLIDALGFGNTRVVRKITGGL